MTPHTPEQGAINVRSWVKHKTVFAMTGSGLISLAALMMSNPGQDAYVDYAAERFPAELKQDCDEPQREIRVGGVITLPSEDLCRSLVDSADLVGRGVVKLLIDRSTDRTNLGAFSIYTTTIAGRTIKTVGIGRHFIPFYHQ
ncbi:MAG: DUF4359 domain-containing protein [Cyanobacteria bacterium J06607_6]